MQPRRLGVWVAVLAVLFCLQLAWWGFVIVRQARAIHDAQVAVLWERSRRAQDIWEQRAQALGDPAAAWRELAASFPGVVHAPQNREQPVQPSGAELERLGLQLERRRIMVIGEGLLFALLVLMGLWLLQRTAQREAFLALQHQNFLHAVTHEFRSPLQSLRLAVESLLRRPDRARSYGEGMLEDVGRLESLVENVLTVGRLDAEAFRAAPARMDLSRAIQDRLQRMPLGDGDPPSWLRTVIRPEVFASADEASLEPILRNLLDNARKYGEGKPVTVQLAREGERAVLRVRDQGRGFTPEERRHLFERFWRAGDERVRTAPGVGLGLFLVAELARAQGARVDARSDGPASGAEFSVSWPAA
ncbi:MAG: HAMP domain-containing histidine kinase [Planctomycetota bacterium]|nr:MAG: HAMP domain-containing histidine kinase [Planctomycetota bacterium]